MSKGMVLGEMTDWGENVAPPELNDRLKAMVFALKSFQAT